MLSVEGVSLSTKERPESKKRDMAIEITGVDFNDCSQQEALDFQAKMITIMVHVTDEISKLTYLKQYHVDPTKEERQ